MSKFDRNPDRSAGDSSASAPSPPSPNRHQTPSQTLFNVDSRYAIYDSDSDDDLTEAEVAVKAKTVNSAKMIHDIDALKRKAQTLLVSDYKSNKIKLVVDKMLDLNDLSISENMVYFMCIDEVAGLIMSYISAIDETGKRPNPQKIELTQTLKLAVKVCGFLCPKDYSEPYVKMLEKKCAYLTKLAFNIFCDTSTGSFFHSYKLYETFLRLFPGELIKGLCAEGKGFERMCSCLRFVGFPPVYEIIYLLLTFHTVNRGTSIYMEMAEMRADFLNDLNRLGFLNRFVDAICHPEQIADCSSYVTGNEHSCTAVDLLIEVVELFCSEDAGEVFLIPFGDEELLDKVFACAVDLNKDSSAVAQCNAVKLLNYIVKKCIEPDIVYLIPGDLPGDPPHQTSIPNRLHVFKSKIVPFVDARMPQVFARLSSFATVSKGDDVSTKDFVVTFFASSTAKEPFSSLRSHLIELLVLMVETLEYLDSIIPIDLWKELVLWSVVFSSNNVYHNYLARMILSVLRRNNEIAVKNLFQKARLVSFLLENYITLPSAGRPPRATDNLMKKRTEVRGFLLVIFNTIRLQISSLPPQQYLKTFILLHDGWKKKYTQMVKDTLIQKDWGMGVHINERNGSHSNVNLITNSNDIDLGSRYANSLGFYGVVPFVESMGDSMIGGIKNSKKKKKKKKRCSMTGEMIEIEVETHEDDDKAGDDDDS